MIRSPQQTEYWQRDVIASAMRKGELEKLYWFVQMTAPVSRSVARGMSQQQLLDYRYRTACAPGPWVPVLPVAPDPARSRIDAEWMAFLFSIFNDTSIRFSPALCLDTELAGVRYYVFGSTWDCVCGRCGEVFAYWHPGVDICDECVCREGFQLISR